MGEVLVLLADRATFYTGYHPIIHGWPPEGLFDLSGCFISFRVSHDETSMVVIENIPPE